MRTLLANLENKEQQELEVALDSFTGTSVHTATGIEALELARRSQFDLCFLGIKVMDEETEQLLESIVETQADLNLVAVANQQVLNELKEKSVRGTLWHRLEAPVDPLEVYKTISRALAAVSGATA